MEIIKITTIQEWYDEQSQEYEEYLNEFKSNKILNAYSKLPTPARNFIRKTKKEVKSSVINKNTGKIRPGATAVIVGSHLVPLPGAGLAGFASVKGYDK